jgi:hypothetical protein
MEFVVKNNKIYTNDSSINLITDNITNKLFYFSEISGNNVSINLYLDKSQITENLNFDCLFPSDSKIVKIYVSNKEYPFYVSNKEYPLNDKDGITTEYSTNISYIKQSINIIIDNNNFNIFSQIKRFKKY